MGIELIQHVKMPAFAGSFFGLLLSVLEGHSHRKIFQPIRQA